MGRLATAVRFGSRPAPPAGRHLTGQKGLQDVPYESGPVDRLLTATGGLRTYSIIITAILIKHYAKGD